MQKITPNLWFDGNPEEAMNFYLSIFNDAKVVEVTRHQENQQGVPGAVMTATFEIEGQQFVALNGGPQYKFTPAVAFNISCKTQAEVDHYWYKLIADGGEEGPCGWLTDRFGVSWIVVPEILVELMNDPHPTKAQRVTQAMFQMKKIDIAQLQAAADS